MSSERKSFTTKRSVRVECDILEALGSERMTAWQLAAKSGWSHPTVHKYLRKLEAENKVRIIGWVNHVVMIWSAGCGRPAPRPPKVDKKQAMQQWRRRNRQHLERYQIQANEKQRVIRAAKRQAREQTSTAGMWGALIVPGK